MKILHPDKDHYLPLSELQEYYVNGYYTLIGKKEQRKLNYFLKSFEDYRTKNKLKITEKALYPNLPFSINTAEWKSRQKDTKIINKLIKDKIGLNILDLGTWNGWLCNYYAKKGHNTVGVDIFTDSEDGLQAAKNYNTSSTFLQLYPSDIYRIKSKFDLIVFNNNWAFIQNKKKVLLEAKRLLAPNGHILLTGLFFYRKEPKNYYLKNLDLLFKETYGIPILNRPSKGFLDRSDKILLSSNCVKLYAYSSIRNMLKNFMPEKKKSYYAVIKSSEY